MTLPWLYSIIMKISGNGKIVLFLPKGTALFKHSIGVHFICSSWVYLCTIFTSILIKTILSLKSKEDQIPLTFAFSFSMTKTTSSTTTNTTTTTIIIWRRNQLTSENIPLTLKSSQFLASQTTKSLAQGKNKNFGSISCKTQQSSRTNHNNKKAECWFFSLSFLVECNYIAYSKNSNLCYILKSGNV